MSLESVAFKELKEEDVENLKKYKITGSNAVDSFV